MDIDELIATKPKATIIQVGLVIDQPIVRWDAHRTVYDPEPKNLVTLWNMDCLGIIPAVEIMPDGSILVGGYTIDELREMFDAQYGVVEGYG